MKVRTVMSGIVLMLCMNMGTWMLTYVSSPWQIGTNSTVTPEDLAEQFDPNSTRTGWTGRVSEAFNYVFDTVQFIWNIIGTTFYGFPYFLQNLGAPYFVYMPLYGIWSFFGIAFFWEIILGREIL